MLFSRTCTRIAGVVGVGFAMILFSVATVLRICYNSSTDARHSPSGGAPPFSSAVGALSF